MLHPYSKFYKNPLWKIFYSQREQGVVRHDVTTWIPMSDSDHYTIENLKAHNSKGQSPFKNRKVRQTHEKKA